MTTYTVRMTDRDASGLPVERTVTVEAANTAVARWKALSLHGSDAAEAVSVHNDDWGKADEEADAESARLRDLWAKLDAESGYTR